MAGLVPAIHAVVKPLRAAERDLNPVQRLRLFERRRRVDARDKLGHEGRLAERFALVLLVAHCFCPAHAAELPAKPQRIVSLNQCTDELALRLADPQNIASVSWLSRDPDNANMAEESRRHPANMGGAEEAISYRPDLVVVGTFTPRQTRAMLKRIGAPIVEFSPPETFEAVREDIRKFARVVGEPERGEALVAEMDRDLDAVTVDPRLPKLKTIILRPNGYTVGPGSLVDEILDRAGLENMAARLDIGAYQQMSLERVALLEADVLIANSEGAGAPSLATEDLRHPLVQALGSKLRVVALPARLITCPGPGLVEAVRILADATRDARARLASP
jgi:iron complex transport system substrate-binding protein